MQSFFRRASTFSQLGSDDVRTHLRGQPVRVIGAAPPPSVASDRIMIGEIAEGFDPALAQHAARFARHAGAYGVPASALGQVFTWLGQHYRLSACSARRCKFPFTAERVSDGRRIRLPCKVIRAAFLAKSSPEQSEVLGTGLVLTILTATAD
jgi:hypothetical protein